MGRDVSVNFLTIPPQCVLPQILAMNVRISLTVTGSGLRATYAPLAQGAVKVRVEEQIHHYRTDLCVRRVHRAKEDKTTREPDCLAHFNRGV